MGLFDLFKKKNEDPMADLLKAFAEGIAETGLSVDELPDGYGKFGLDKTNPIPTNFSFGSDEYLSQIRTIEGKSIKFSRLGSVTAENFPDTPIDMYQIESTTGSKLAVFYLCMYHKRNSNKAPEGFYLKK
jgi:hypothetical protein